jgi:curved DNA-binding protein CbpA
VTADPAQLAFDPYAVLGVAPHATAPEIHHAYRVLARRFHPDTNRDGRTAALFAQVSRAYEVLGDVDRRRAYDLRRAVATGPRAARVAPGPTGNTAVRGPAAWPQRRPTEPEPERRAPADDGRDEFRFLITLAKLVAVVVTLIVLGALILALRPGPWCVAPGAPGPNPCGAPVASSAP